MDRKIQYLNTDLDLTSAKDLTALGAALEEQGLFPLHITHGEDGLWYATFETEQQFAEPEPNIAALLSAIESLEEGLRRTWDTCSRREFNLGYDCGEEPWAFNHGLSNAILARLARAGGSLRITLYPDKGDGAGRAVSV